MVNYADVSTSLAQAFVDNPANFVAEADLQYRLTRELQRRLSPGISTVEAPFLTSTPNDSVRDEYAEAVRAKLERAGSIDRVHTEVSVEQGERPDVAAFRPTIEHGVEWVSGGSKRFDDRDLEAAFELSFVENKSSLPTVTGETASDRSREDLSVDDLVDRSLSENPVLDLRENELAGNVRELNRLENVDERYLLLFSNKNYLYHSPGAAETDDHRDGQLHGRLGIAARRWLHETAADPVGVLYAYPGG